MRRKLNTPAIFLCALALGAWVGASFHFTSSQQLTASQSCGACCSFIASISKTSAKPQLNAASISDESTCAACLAGALVYHAPVTTHVELFESSIPSDTTVLASGVRIEVHIHAHPPERGPPA
ncbi:MAG: hypothetical protein WCT04_09145 [Planctomycetota bacterium]